MRGLKQDFLLDLNNGRLKSFLMSVIQDDSLCLEIRENYINVYYRGGNILRIKPVQSKYEVFFDANYCSKFKDIISGIGAQDYSTWVRNIPYIKSEMDFWFHKHPKLEREYQQLVLRENNNSNISKDTDYFIADIEYANNENGSRFDLLALKWKSDSDSRRKADNITLVFIEKKYGDSALAGSAGLQKHIKDMNSFLSDSAKVDNFFDEMETVFNQKVKLGLIPDIKKEIHISRELKPEFILLFANHKPIKSVFKRELKAAVELPEYESLKELADIKVATASFMGYGLYDQNMISLEDFINEY